MRNGDKRRAREVKEKVRATTISLSLSTTKDQVGLQL